MSSNLSVLITNYNHAQYLDFCLARITQQSLPAQEIIIIDDASTDESVRIIKKYSQAFKQIKFYQNKVNRGVIANQKRLLELSTCKYIYWASSDDYIDINFFKITLKAMKKLKEVKIAFSYPSTVSNNKVNVNKILKKYNSITFFSPSEFSSLLRYKLNYLHINSVIFEKEAFIQAGAFVDENLKGNYDMVVYHAIAFIHGIAFIPQSLSYLRLHRDQFSRNTAVERKAIANIYLMVLSNDKYSDIKHYFMNSGILVAICSNCLKLLMNKKNYRFITLPFLFWYVKLNGKKIIKKILMLK